MPLYFSLIVPSSPPRPLPTSATVYGASSFNKRLGGAWVSSNADMLEMFDGGCKGTLLGKRNNPWDGTPQK